MKKDSSIRYTKTKKNILGKTKTKDISENKYKRLSSRFSNKGGETWGITRPSLLAGESSKVVERVKNKRGTKSVAKTMYK